MNHVSCLLLGMHVTLKCYFLSGVKLVSCSLFPDRVSVHFCICLSFLPLLHVPFSSSHCYIFACPAWHNLLDSRVQIINKAKPKKSRHFAGSHHFFLGTLTQCWRNNVLNQVMLLYCVFFIFASCKFSASDSDFYEHWQFASVITC